MSRENFLVCLALLKHTLREEIRKEKRRIECKRLWTRNWILRREELGATSNLIRELSGEDPLSYKNILRMSEEHFTDLLHRTAPFIQRQDTNMRMAIPADVKLQVTLRYLATGDSFKSLAYLFRVPPNSISVFLPEVLAVIADVLKDELKIPKNEDEWRGIGTQFKRKWNFPKCGGAIDGKHIRIQRPKGSGSEYYNYKGYYSLLLLALVDADYCFIYVDIGANGRAGDAGVFADSSLNMALEGRTMNFPEDHVIVGDDAFPLRKDLLKPYATTSMSMKKRIFNYRLSRARRIVENAFGILVWRFRIFLRPIEVKLETTDRIILTACTLHNWLRRKNSASYLPHGSVDYDDYNTGEVIRGAWRDCHDGFHSLQRQGSNNYSRSAEARRNWYAEYFMNDGSVPWQWKAVGIEE